MEPSTEPQGVCGKHNKSFDRCGKCGKLTFCGQCNACYSPVCGNAGAAFLEQPRFQERVLEESEPRLIELEPEESKPELRELNPKK